MVLSPHMAISPDFVPTEELPEGEDVQLQNKSQATKGSPIDDILVIQVKIEVKIA